VIREQLLERCGTYLSLSGWWRGPLCAIDTETTGVNVEEDRIVEIALVLMDLAGPLPGSMLEIVKSGVSIPPRAEMINHLTDDYVEEVGAEPEGVLWSVLERMESVVELGWPVVVFNATYDLPLLWNEMARHGVGSTDFVRKHMAVIDPTVLDKHCAPWRRGKGKRTLEALAKEAGVVAPGQHSAWADCIMSAGLARFQAKKWTEVSSLTLPQLYESQKTWHSQWMGEFNSWLRRKGKPPIREEWPHHRYPEEE
jgi:DNA polymerase-3 subunit epsilon